MSNDEQTIEKVLKGVAPDQRVRILKTMLDQIAEKEGGHAAAVRTPEGRALYNALETEKRIRSGGLDAYSANQVRKSVDPEHPTGTREQLQAEFDVLVKRHMSDHGIERSAAAVAVLKTSAGRMLYSAIDSARRAP